MEVRHLGRLLYTSLKDVIHTTTRGQERWQCLLAILLSWRNKGAPWKKKGLGPNAGETKFNRQKGRQTESKKQKTSRQEQEWDTITATTVLASTNNNELKLISQAE